MVFVQPFVTLLRAGEPEKAMHAAAHRARGTISASGQNHFYMETQTAVASVIDGQYVEVICGTQDPTSYQNYVAGVLDLDVGKVTINHHRCCLYASLVTSCCYIIKYFTYIHVSLF